MSFDFGRRLLLASVAAWLAAGIQSRAQELEFEVATIKLVKGPVPMHAVNLFINHGRFHIDAARLSQIIGQAYDIQTVRVLGGPGWLNSDLYDIVAKTDRTDAGADQIRVMLQGLLAERCKLAVHRETRQLPVYALVVAKNGPKLPEAKEEEQQRFESGRGRAVLQKQAMGGFANFLANTLGSPVSDKTGLTGFYNFKLEWTDPQFQKSGTDSGLSLFGALEEQLGLKMEVKKGPVEVLVVDHVERPSEN